MALGRIVQQRGDQQVGVVTAGGDQAPHHVERVATIGDRHGREQRPGRCRQQPTGRGRLGRRDAGPHMPEELLDPVHGDQAPTRRSARP